MAKSSICIILLLVGFLCCNSCKKAESPVCNTVPDCQVIGRYMVSAFSYFHSGTYSHETSYQNRIITLTEQTPGVIHFIDTSFNVNMNASYDVVHSRTDFPVFVAGDTSISLSGGDTIDISCDYIFSASTGSSANWHGVKVR